jgi:hypothetical protein
MEDALNRLSNYDAFQSSFTVAPKLTLDVVECCQSQICIHHAAIHLQLLGPHSPGTMECRTAIYLPKALDSPALFPTSAFKTFRQKESWPSGLRVNTISVQGRQVNKEVIFDRIRSSNQVLCWVHEHIVDGSIWIRTQIC